MNRYPSRANAPLRTEIFKRVVGADEVVSPPGPSPAILDRLKLKRMGNRRSSLLGINEDRRMKRIQFRKLEHLNLLNAPTQVAFSSSRWPWTHQASSPSECEERSWRLSHTRRALSVDRRLEIKSWSGEV